MAVTRRLLRYSLIVVLTVSTLFAAWAWFRPYEWSSDPAARCKVVAALVTRDKDYRWLDIHLKVNSGQEHDMMKPVRLELAGGQTLEAADTTFVGTPEQKTTDIWLKFWLEEKDLAGPVTLHLNDGKLVIKKSSGIPQLGNSVSRNFTTNQW